MARRLGFAVLVLVLMAFVLPLASTAEGQVYTVDDNHVERLVADTDERQVGALVLTGATRFVATTDPFPPFQLSITNTIFMVPFLFHARGKGAFIPTRLK